MSGLLFSKKRHRGNREKVPHTNERLRAAELLYKKSENPASNKWSQVRRINSRVFIRDTNVRLTK